MRTLSCRIIVRQLCRTDGLTLSSMTVANAFWILFSLVRCNFGEGRIVRLYSNSSRHEMDLRQFSFFSYAASRVSLMWRLDDPLWVSCWKFLGFVLDCGALLLLLVRPHSLPLPLVMLPCLFFTVMYLYHSNVAHGFRYLLGIPRSVVHSSVLDFNQNEENMRAEFRVVLLYITWRYFTPCYVA